MENPKSGRGLACWRTTAQATKAIADWLKLPINENTILFHRDDPETKKSCPGTKVLKPWVLDLINSAATPTNEPIPDKTTLDVTLANNQWRFIGERWCIPVRAYLIKKGIADATIAANLKKKGNQLPRTPGRRVLRHPHFRHLGPRPRTDLPFALTTTDGTDHPKGRSRRLLKIPYDEVEGADCSSELGAGFHLKGVMKWLKSIVMALAVFPAISCKAAPDQSIADSVASVVDSI